MIVRHRVAAAVSLLLLGAVTWLFSIEEDQVITSANQTSTGLKVVTASNYSSGDENSPKLPQLNNESPSSFAICLMMMDENKILPEWLAYHFQVLPLRRLILGRDAKSRTSPKHILDGFQTVGLNSTLWELEPFGNRSHLIQQEEFYTACAKQLKLEGHQSYVAFIDADEYLSFNYLTSTSKDPIGVPCRNANDFGNVCLADGSPVLMMGKYNITLPKLGNTTLGSFMAALPAEVIDARPGSFRCEVLPRLNIKTDCDSASLPTVHDELLSEFALERFRTIRDRSFEHVRAVMPGKSIVHLAQWAGRHPVGIHKANKNCFGYHQVDMSLSFLRVHQYQGTLDEFLVPTSKTRTKGYFETRNSFPLGGQLDEEVVVGWLRSFVRQVGRDRALYLTKGLQEWARKDFDAAFDSHSTYSSVSANKTNWCE